MSKSVIICFSPRFGSQAPSNFNEGAVSNNDYALGWCQWLLQVQFTFVVEKDLEVKVISLLSSEAERISLLARNACLKASNVIFGTVMGFP